MTYTSYEIIPAKLINNRIIPRIWKLSRNDGSFDLFCLSTFQHNCMQYLASIGQAGVFVGRDNSDSIRGLGEYYMDGDNRSTFSRFSIHRRDDTRYGSVPKCSLRLDLRNSVNLYPYRIRGFNYSEHNAGSRWLQVFNGRDWITKTGGPYNQGNWGGGSYYDRVEATLWQLDLSNLSTVFDYRDYTQLNVMFRAVDGSKYTGSSASLSVEFIHRFTDGHPLHRYYR